MKFRIALSLLFCFLEAEVATLKKNSSNSSKPPSSDIVQPPQQSTSKGKKRKRGAHWIREVKFLAESEDKAVARYGNRLRKKIRKMFSTIHRRDELWERNWQRRMRADRDAILRTA